jgi:hypothetical protein
MIRSVAVPSPVAGVAAPFSADVADVWSPVTTRWSFGDGAGATGAAASHVFGAAGASSATVTAIDARGMSATATRGLSIAAAPPAPPVSAPAPAPSAAPRAAAPRASRPLTVRGVALTRRDVRFRLSSPARVTVVIERCATRCRRVRTLTVAGRAGSNRVGLGRRRLARGRYRVSVARSGQRAVLKAARVRISR